MAWNSDVFVDSFEEWSTSSDMNNKWDVSDTGTTQTSIARTGERAVQDPQLAHTWSGTVADAGFGFYQLNQPFTTVGFFSIRVDYYYKYGVTTLPDYFHGYCGLDGATNRFFFAFPRMFLGQTDFSVLYFNGSAIAFEVWNHIEFKYEVTITKFTSTITVTLWINEEPFDSKTITYDMQTTPKLEGYEWVEGSADITVIYLGGSGVFPTPGAFGDTVSYVDDFYCTKTAALHGDLEILPLHPDGDVTTEWTRNGGTTNFGRINEQLLDGDVSYVEAESVGLVDRYTFEDTGLDPDDPVYGFQVIVYASKDSIGSASYKPTDNLGKIYTEEFPGSFYSADVWGFLSGGSIVASDIDGFELEIERIT